MANSCLLLLNHVYLLTCDSLALPGIQDATESNWTQAEEGAPWWASQWLTFYWCSQHSPHSLNSCVLHPLCPASPPSDRHVSWCASLITLRTHKTSFPGSNKHARDERGVLWKPSLERWVTESKFCPVTVSCVITRQEKQASSLYQMHCQAPVPGTAGREKQNSQ